MGHRRVVPIGAAALLLGVVSVLGVTFVPDAWLRDGNWSGDDAKRLQDASAEVHRLSLGDLSEQQTSAALRDAQGEFADLQVRRESSAESGRRRKRVLLWGGVAMAAAGAGVLLAAKNRAA